MDSGNCSVQDYQETSQYLIDFQFRFAFHLSGYIYIYIYIYMRYHLTATGKKTKQALVFLYWRQGFGTLPDDLFRTGTGSTCVRNT